MNCSPAGVSEAPALLRTNSLAPSSASSVCTRTLTAVCVTCRRSAARTKLPQATISRKVRARAMSMRPSMRKTGLNYQQVSFYFIVGPAEHGSHEAPPRQAEARVRAALPRGRAARAGGPAVAARPEPARCSRGPVAQGSGAQHRAAPLVRPRPAPLAGIPAQVPRRAGAAAGDSSSVRRSAPPYAGHPAVRSARPGAQQRGGAARNAQQTRRLPMKAKDIMTSPVVTVGPATPVNEIAALLYERRISALPVVEGGRMVGIVSEADLLHRHELGTDCIAQSGSWWLRLFSADRSVEDYIKSHARQARDIMTREVVSVAPDTGIAEVASVLERHGVRRVPVLQDGQLLGIVSRANLVQALAGTAQGAVRATPPSDRAIRARLLAEL